MDLVSFEHIDTSSFSGFSTATSSLGLGSSPLTTPASRASSRLPFARLAALSSHSDSEVETILIGLQADKKFREDCFVYALEHLVEKKNCRVLVLCCLSIVYDEMHTPHPVDVRCFRGLPKPKIEAPTRQQMNFLNHRLGSFRKALEYKGVQLNIRVVAGPRKETIFLDGARVLRPHWVVLDKAFNNKRTLRLLEEGLDCSVFVMTDKIPVMLKLKDNYLGPNSEKPWAQRDMSGHFGTLGDSSTLSRHSYSETTHSSSTGRRSVQSSTPTNLHVSNSSMITNVHVSDLNQSWCTTEGNHYFDNFNCFCCPTKGITRDTRHIPEDGPGGNVSVLYSETPLMSAVYLRAEGSASPSFSADSPIRDISPGASRRPVVRARAIKRTAKKIEHKLEAAMYLATDDDDPTYQVLI